MVWRVVEGPGGYDAAGNLTSTTLPAGNGYVETRSYDRAGRLTEVKDVKGASTLSDFVQTLDPVGNPLALTRSGSISSTASYGYDNLDRLTSVCFQASCPNPSDPKISWTYDGVGNRLSETRAAGSTGYSYDGDDRLTQTTSPGSNPYAGQVQTDGAQPYWRLSETSGTSFASSVGSYTGTWTGAPTLGVAGALNGDPNTAVTLNGTSQYGTVPNASGLGKTNNFSLELWLKRSKSGASQAVVGKPLTTTTKSENYAFWLDTANKVRFEVGAGNKSATVTSAAALDTGWHHVVGTFASGSLKLSVDGALSASATATFTAAAANTGTLDVGRAGTGSYYGGSLDEIALYGSALSASQVSDHYNKGHNAPPPILTSYGYDDDGRQTAAGGNSYSWNLANVMAAATVGGTSISYSYDGDGNRLNSTAGGVTTKQLWDSNYALPQLALERDGSNSLLRRYLIGLKANSMTTPAGNFFYHYDPIGSVTNLTDSAGETQWTYSYEPYGNPQTTVKNVQTAPASRLGFTGQYLDPTSTLYNLRARQYDTRTGRFLTTDPASTPDDAAFVGPYVYADSDPIVLVDPSGLSGIGAMGSWASGIVGGVSSFGRAWWTGANELANDSWGGCINGSVTGFHVSGSIGACLQHSRSGEWGFTFTPGGSGNSRGFGGSASVVAQVSNAQCLRDLGGWFTEAQGSAGVGYGVTGGAFTNRRKSVIGGNYGGGVGLFYTGSIGETYTFPVTVAGSCHEGQSEK